MIAMARAGYNKLMHEVVSNSTGKAPVCIEMLGSTSSDEEGITAIVGNIRNNCDRRFGHVTVLFKLERPAGPLKDMPEPSAYAYVSDLEPGETRPFKTAIPLSKDVMYLFEGINAY